MNPISMTLVAFVRGYQLVVSPWMPPSCRFEPTCSHYAIDAIRTHGPATGLVLSLWRLLRCTPLFSGGADPVPAAPLFGRHRASRPANR